MSGTIDNQVEYALYALAVHCPVLFDDAERFVGGMLANDTTALARVKAMVRASQSSDLDTLREAVNGYLAAQDGAGYVGYEIELDEECRETRWRLKQLVDQLNEQQLREGSAGR